MNSLDTEKQLELYRQSVLKDAFEGKLTAHWRAANPDEVNPQISCLHVLRLSVKPPIKLNWMPGKTQLDNGKVLVKKVRNRQNLS